ncbi:PsiF family protein [Pseudomonas sp. FEN]|uniref:PsiF family protein n=1 Tax=Pseudomonas sp. FEN TaxID=2767468 RepID=UPI00174935EC|nr:PsiF family protein [Pseudomonas sp. FEN]CAD5198837.1 Phosphate starvation-inducible protein PsiF [Pseudomonas sp. FEN]
MKMLRIPLLLVGLLLCSQGFAATAQQSKMSTCNADAKAQNLAGDARKSFMSNCLKAAPAAATPAAATPAAPATKPATAAVPAKVLTPQQQKMKDCNANKPQGLKGDAYKAYMSNCLKKK